MAQQTLNAPQHDRMGVPTTDPTTERGDGYKTLVDKIQAMFTELYTLVAGVAAVDLDLIEQANNATVVGAKADPVSGTVACAIERTGKFVSLTFTLTAAQIPVTDGAASGSFGSLKIFDFAEAAVSFLGCRQNYTAFAEGAALTGAAGDAAFEIGVGTSTIEAAADGTLGNGVNENVGQAVAVTLSGGTGTGTAVDGAKTTALDGTGTALALYLNWSGSAATIDADSTIDVTGTVTVVLAMMGDD
jgi:hypothetical protein